MAGLGFAEICFFDGDDDVEPVIATCDVPPFEALALMCTGLCGIVRCALDTACFASGTLPSGHVFAFFVVDTCWDGCAAGFSATCCTNAAGFTPAAIAALAADAVSDAWRSVS